MHSSRNSTAPSTVRVENLPDHFGLTAVRVSGPGPDHVQLPDTLAPDDYRICEETRDGEEPMCALLTVG